MFVNILKGLHFRFILILLALIPVGCATSPERVNVADLPSSAPSPEAILDDLEENDKAIQNFRGKVKFVLKSPSLENTQKRRGNVSFRRPHDLYVEVNHRVTGFRLFKLMCIDQEFLMEISGNRDEYYYEIEGTEYEEVSFSVSPSDIAREMFFSEDWGGMRRSNITMTDWDEETGVVTLEVHNDSTLRRRIETIQVMPESPRWVIIQNERFDTGGKLIAVTRLDHYGNRDGLVFPLSVDAHYPTEETRMSIEVTDIRLNIELDEDDFDIKARARELRLL